MAEKKETPKETSAPEPVAKPDNTQQTKPQAPALQHLWGAEVKGKKTKMIKGSESE